MKIKDIVVVEIMIRVRLHWWGIKDTISCLECPLMILYPLEQLEWNVQA